MPIDELKQKLQQAISWQQQEQTALDLISNDIEILASGVKDKEKNNLLRKKSIIDAKKYLFNNRKTLIEFEKFLIESHQGRTGKSAAGENFTIY